MNLPLNILEGNHLIVCVFIRIGSEWRLPANASERREQVWNFASTKVARSQSGEISVEGILTRYSKGNQKFSTEYVFYPLDGRLYINWSQRPDSSYIYFIANSYGVWQSAHGKLWLSHIEDNGNRRNEYIFRMK